MKQFPLFVHIICVLFFNTVHSQIAKYDFNNNIQDEINGHDLSSFVLDANQNIPVNTTNSTYVSDNNGVQIVLDSLHGLKLPSSLKEEVDFTKSIEISFTFTLTDLGPGEGEKYLINWQRDLNSPGMAIWFVHNPYSNEEDYTMFFSYSDGAIGTPGHLGHNKVPIGYHFKDEVINVSLIIDFENKDWTSFVNGKYVKQDFITEMYDWDTMLLDAKTDDWYFGWKGGQENVMQEEVNIFTSTININELTIYSPRKPLSSSDLITALEAMTAHVDGSVPLSLEERTTNLETAQFNYHGNYDTAFNAIFNYINAYESAYPSIFQNGPPQIILELLPETGLQYFLQQSIFNEEYTLENMADFVGVVYEDSNHFPGPVSSTAIRTSAATVSLNGTYSYNPAARVAGDLGDAKRPTGYYAAPGEMISITIPNTAVNAGLKVMLGAHDEDLSSFLGTNRFGIISKTYALSSETTQIVSPFGGGLYIKVPEGTNMGWFDVLISGAVQSPYFSWRTDRKTLPSDWATEIENQQVAWVDLESDNYMMTLPLTVVETTLDPSLLMTQWDEIMDGFWYVGGRSEPRRRSQYFIVDSQLNGPGFGTGYPQLIGDYNAPSGPLEATGMYPTHILNPNFWQAQGLETTLHEHGHGDGHPTLEYETETINNLNAVYVYNVVFDVPLDEAFKYSLGESFYLDEATMDWMIAQNFRTNQLMECDPTMPDLVCSELRYQHRGWAKYVKMAELFGWSSVYEMNNVFYEDWRINFPDNEGLEVTPDNVISGASYGSNVNMAPLMHFYGLHPSEELREELEALPCSPEILDLLQYYKELIPSNTDEFEVWYDNLKHKKDPVHHDRYDYALANFETDGYAQAMRDQIDAIIALYFSNCESLAVDSPASINTIHAYPNPFDQYYTIESLVPFSLKVTDMSGRVLIQKNLKAGESKINTSRLSAGNYIFQFNSQNKSSVRKLIKR